MIGLHYSYLLIQVLNLFSHILYVFVVLYIDLVVECTHLLRACGSVFLCLSCSGHH